MNRNSAGYLVTLKIEDENFAPLTLLCFSLVKKNRKSTLNFSVKFRSKTIPLSVSLERLSVERTPIDPIFRQLTRLTRLKSFFLIERNLTSTNASIVNLKSLVSLNLAENDLEVLPSTNLPSIVDFNLSNNNLKKFRDWETFGEKNEKEKTFYFNANAIRRLDMKMKKIRSNFSNISELNFDAFCFASQFHL